jgi:hypothetical protein
MTKCLNCKTDTTNPKFCSRSCSAIHSNKMYPRRKPKTMRCKTCKSELPIIRGSLNQVLKKVYCDNCNPNNIDWSAITKKDITGKRNYQTHSRIRELARQEYKRSNLPELCKICGYSIHVEICHIIAIKDFDDSTPISVINSKDNLVALCPNHHWEFDRGRIFL